MTDLIDPVDDRPWPEPRTDGTTPETALRVPFSIGIGLSLVIWSVVAQLVAAIFFAAAGTDLDSPVSLRMVVVASQGLTLAGALLAMRASGRLSWRLWGPTRPQVRDLAMGLGVGLAGYAIVITWAVLYTVAFGEPAPTDQALLEDLSVSTTVLVLSFVAAAVLAPVVEEVIFRGVLFQAARRQLGLWPGVALSTFVFTVVHVELYPPLGLFQPVGLGGLVLLGAWLAWMFHRTGSLAVPIIGHAVFNAINLTIAVVAATA